MSAGISKLEGRRCCCRNTLHMSWSELDGGICWRGTLAFPLNNYTGLQLGISVCRACQGMWELLLIPASLVPSWGKGKSWVERKGTCGDKEGEAVSSTRCWLKLCPGVKVIFGKQYWINAVRISKERRSRNLLFLNDLICWGGSRLDVDNSYLSLFLKENIRLGTKWYLRKTAVIKLWGFDPSLVYQMWKAGRELTEQKMENQESDQQQICNWCICSAQIALAFPDPLLDLKCFNL